MFEWYPEEAPTGIKPVENDTTLIFQNHKFCKIRPKFLPIMHFLQEFYKFVQESQILQVCQVCYNAERFLQEADNIFAKFASICKKFLQKYDVISTKKFVQDFLDPFCVLFE